MGGDGGGVFPDSLDLPFRQAFFPDCNRFGAVSSRIITAPTEFDRIIGRAVPFNGLPCCFREGEAEAIEQFLEFRNR